MLTRARHGDAVVVSQGGWGSIEYGTVNFTKGQVIGGRWKPLHYWYKASIFADVMATCGVGGACFVVNDGILPFTGSVTVEYVGLANSSTTTIYHEDLHLSAGAGVIKPFTVTLPTPPPTPMPPPTPPAGDCDFANNTDWLPKTTDPHWHPAGPGMPTPVGTPSDCCALCDADPTCVVATFAEGRCPPCPGICGCCYLKTKADQSGGSFARVGVFSCKKKTSATTAVDAAPATKWIDPRSQFILVATVTAADGAIASTHPVLYVPPKDLLLPDAHVQFTLSDADKTAPTITVTTDAVALFVTFTTLAQGRFSDNAFLLMPGGARTIVFHPFEGFDFAELKATLRVEHVASYI